MGHIFSFFLAQHFWGTIIYWVGKIIYWVGNCPPVNMLFSLLNPVTPHHMVINQKDNIPAINKNIFLNVLKLVCESCNYVH